MAAWRAVIEVFDPGMSFGMAVRAVLDAIAEGLEQSDQRVEMPVHITNHIVPDSAGLIHWISSLVLLQGNAWYVGSCDLLAVHFDVESVAMPTASGNHHANAAWLACAVLAHNLGVWTTTIAGLPRVTNRTRRTRIINLPAVIVNHAGTKLLRFPARWPWADQFHKMLNTVRALPAPSG